MQKKSSINLCDVFTSILKVYITGTLATTSMPKYMNNVEKIGWINTVPNRYQTKQSMNDVHIANDAM